MWVNDGQRNPGFNVTFAVRESLRVAAAPSDGSLPLVDTPASLVEVSAVVVAVALPRS